MDRNKTYISVGAESADDEYQAVVDILAAAGNETPVGRNYVRASYDHLPMVVMVIAQGVATNAIWDLIKLTYRKLLSDPRLSKRKPTIIIKRNTFDAVISEKGLHVRSVEENLTFDDIDSLIEYDERKRGV